MTNLIRIILFNQKASRNLKVFHPNDKVCEKHHYVLYWLPVHKAAILLCPHIANWTFLWLSSLNLVLEKWKDLIRNCFLILYTYIIINLYSHVIILEDFLNPLPFQTIYIVLLPYARHYNPRFVYFLPTFWSSFMYCDLWPHI